MIVDLVSYNGSVVGLVSRSGETLHSGLIETGELQICSLVSSSKLDSAHCFPFFMKDSASNSESDPSALFSDLDRGLESLSYSWMSALGSPKYGCLVVPSCSNLCQ